MSGVFDMTLPLGLPGYDGIRRHGSVGRVVLGLGHLDHAQKMAAYMSGLHELDQFLACEPAVYQKVIEAEPFKDGPFDHSDKIVHLALEVFFLPLGRAPVRIAFLAISLIQLLLRQALRLRRFLPHLALEGEVHEGLSLPVREQQEQSLVSEDALVHDVGEDASEFLSLPAGLGKVRIVCDQATGIRALDGVAARRDAAQKPAVEAVHDLPPVDVLVGKEPVKHVLLAREHLAKHTLGVVVSVLDGEEREQDHQFKDLRGRELAVRRLGKLHLPMADLDIAHHVHDSLDRLRIITFGKIAVAFRDNMPIFVHAKECYICLFGNYNIVIINELINFSQRNQP